jgi:PAS domain S-box-containing protein
MPPFLDIPPLAPTRADRFVAAAGRLAAGLAGAFGAAAVLHAIALGGPLTGHRALGVAWALVGASLWCSGAHRRTAALLTGWSSMAAAAWAVGPAGAPLIDTVALILAALAVLLHERDVNAPPADLLGHVGVILLTTGTLSLSADLTGVPIDLGRVGRFGGFPRVALAGWMAGAAVAAKAWLDAGRAEPGGPRWFAPLAGSTACAVTVAIWWALVARETGLATATGLPARSHLPTFVLLMGGAFAALLAAVVALGQRARARSAEAQQTSHQLLEALVDRNIARDALERREALLQTVLETMGEGVVAASATGEFLVYNRAARELLGPDGVLGPRALEWADAEEPGTEVWPSGRQALERALRGEHIDDLDVCLRRSDGHDPRWVSVFARPLTLPAGVNGSMLVLRDVTERRLAQERVSEAARELERSNRELTEFASVASHDLRAPLRSVTSFVTLLDEDYAETFTDEGRTYLTRIKAAVSRMTGLIDGLLTLARVRAKGDPFVVVALGDVVQEVVADLAHGLAESGGSVEIGDLPSVEADRLQMRQLLQNLIGNAIKFRRQGVAPRVVVTARAAGARGDHEGDPGWEIRVADNGIGLDPANAERIFKPFERLHSHASFEGSGLGLAVCARIVERHGGRIRAEADPGFGTTFVVTLPAVRRRREAA